MDESAFDNIDWYITISYPEASAPEIVIDVPDDELSQKSWRAVLTGWIGSYPNYLMDSTMFTINDTGRNVESLVDPCE